MSTILQYDLRSLNIQQYKHTLGKEVTHSEANSTK